MVHTLSVLYWDHLCMKCSIDISNFLKRSLIFPILLFSSFFALITEEGFLISPCYSLELCIQMGISFLFSLPLASLLFSAICKPSSDNHLPSCFSLSWGWSWSLLPLQCHEPPSFRHSFIRFKPLNLSVSSTLYSCVNFVANPLPV